MTLTRNLLSDAVRYGLSAGAVGLLGLAANPAFAQDTTTTTKPEDKAKSLERIEVVGSRIKRAVDYESTSPVTSLTRADIEQSGVTTTFDLLSRITASDGSGLSTVTTQTNGSDGTETISLRNLGPQRTLILVDGKRWPTDINGIVDTSTIPIAIIERVDVLKDGASAIYGSDAVAGVINFITRRKYEGAQVGWYYGQTSHGDGSKSVVDATIGATSDRSSAVVSISRTEQKAIFAGDREISDASVFGCNRILSNRLPAGTPGNSDPDNLSGLCGSTFGQFGRFFGAGLPGAGVALDNSFHDSHNASGNPALARGTSVGGGRFASDFVTWNPLDRYNFAPVNYLQQPTTRNNLFASGRFNITDNVEAFARVNYNQRQSAQQLAQVPTSLSSSGGFGPQWAFGVDANNVFNPFGTQITTAFFRNVAVGPRHNAYDQNTLGSTAGLEGSFNLGERAFNWDIYGQYNSSRSTKIGNNYINLFNLRNAVGPSFRDAAPPGQLGTLHCGTPGAVIANCVPFNLFGGPDLGLAHGIITPAEYAAMINYISYTEVQENANKGINFGANLSGEIAPLQGGMLSFAAGIESRRDRAFFQPDTLVASGGSSDNFTEPSRGQTKIDEAYLELSAPLLKDLPFAKELEIDVAARKSRYSAHGFVGTTEVISSPGNPLDKKYSIRWKPFNDLLLRASYGDTFRAPSVNDLFAGGAENFPAAADPCNNVGFGALTPGPNGGQALCVAQGVPVGGYNQLNTQIRALSGGNPNLGPEKGKNLTYGFVYSPSYVSGLNLTVDYWRISLKDALSTFGAQTILDQCYKQTVPNPADQFCTKVNRLPNGQIIAVRTAQFNAATQLVDGVDVGINYKLDTTGWGVFGLRWDTTYNIREKFNGQEFLGIYTGSPNWRIRSLASLSWQRGDFDASWTARYNSSMVENGGCNQGKAGGKVEGLINLICNHPNDRNDLVSLPPLLNQPNPADNRPVRGLGFNRIGAVVYNDVQIGWRAPWKAHLTIGAKNVFGKEPPYTKGSFASSFDASYDLPGGPFYYFQYRQDF